MTWPEYLAGCCRIGGKLRRLTFLETEVLLMLLLNRPDKFLRANDLIEMIWPNADREPSESYTILKHYIMHLRRRKILIENDYGNGYRITKEFRDALPVV